MKKLNIEFIGKFFDSHSLSIVNRNIVKYLSSHSDKINLAITPLDTFDIRHNRLSKEELSLIKKLSLTELPVKEPDIQLRHSYPPIFRWPLSNKTKVIFIQPWEFTKVPFEWQYKFETFADALITPSKWTANIYLSGGLNPDKLYVIPNGVDPSLFNTENRDRKGKPFTFTFVGNAQYRKGVDILLNAWIKAFDRSENVQLIIKDNPEIYGSTNLLDEVLKAQYKTHCAKIKYDDSILTSEEMANLYKNTDVLVHPYRGEGFGMHIQEAMACGAFPLVSSNGATDDFVSNSNGMLIDVDKKYISISEPQVMAMKDGDSMTLMGGHTSINEPKVEDLINKMQFLVRNVANRQDLEKKVIENSKLNTWESVAKKYLDVFMEEYQNKQICRN